MDIEKTNQNALQKIIIEKYRDRNPGATLKDIAKDTGIQITRVYRIFSGHEMKLSEFLVFRDLVGDGIDFKIPYDDLSKFKSIAADARIIASKITGVNGSLGYLSRKFLRKYYGDDNFLASYQN